MRKISRDLRRRQHRHAVAAVRLELDARLGEQHAQRLADGDHADAEVLRDEVGADPVARLQLAADQLAAQLPQHLVRQRGGPELPRRRVPAAAWMPRSSAASITYKMPRIQPIGRAS